MGTFTEIGKTPKQFKNYIDQLTQLFREHEITSIQSLVHNYRNNSIFKTEWNRIWSTISKEEGGKLSLGTIGAVIGASLGGVGVAAMGSAIGLPLFLVLGLGGFISGAKFDSLNIFGDKKRVSFKVSKTLLKRIQSDAAFSEISVSQYIESIIQSYYNQANDTCENSNLKKINHPK